ncbi:MAG: hypothetical protein IMW89_15490 [Ktedonobacteraceae bacterium]|nr:hypothetical protein [Ktedonobacteraceae bacterium]
MRGARGPDRTEAAGAPQPGCPAHPGRAGCSPLRACAQSGEQAASLLQHEQPEERRQAVLAILEYLGRNDLLLGVREKAQAVLTAATTSLQQSASSTASTLPQEARHLFRVRCKNGHITPFDRRKVCSQRKEIARELDKLRKVRSQRKEIMRGLDELLLSCATCGVEMTVAVDCEGY